MSDPVDAMVDVGGVRLKVQQAGAGAPLLFLHGAGGRNWTALHKRLASHFRVIAPEHPGFGRSPIPEWMNSVGDLAFFYLDLLERMDLRGVHLAGHSLGGWTAGEIAIRNTSRLSSLTLMAPAGVAVPEAPFGDIFLWSTEQATRAQFFDQTLAEKRLAAPADLDLLLHNKTTVARLAWSPRLANPQLPYWLHRIDKPTLFVWGREDRIVPYACAKPWRARVANSELVTIEQCGHAIHNEKPDEAGDAIIAFLNKVKG
jgi:pimeloyl-ACP methyl ester carboxylesterase